MEKRELLLKVKEDVKIIKDEVKTIHKIVSKDVFTHDEIDGALKKINAAKYRLNRLTEIYKEVHEEDSTETKLPE